MQLVLSKTKRKPILENLDALRCQDFGAFIGKAAERQGAEIDLEVSLWPEIEPVLRDYKGALKNGSTELAAVNQLHAEILLGYRNKSIEQVRRWHIETRFAIDYFRIETAIVAGAKEGRLAPGPYQECMAREVVQDGRKLSIKEKESLIGMISKERNIALPASTSVPPLPPPAPPKPQPPPKPEPPRIDAFNVPESAKQGVKTLIRWSVSNAGAVLLLIEDTTGNRLLEQTVTAGGSMEWEFQVESVLILIAMAREEQSAIGRRVVRLERESAPPPLPPSPPLTPAVPRITDFHVVGCGDVINVKWQVENALQVRIERRTPAGVTVSCDLVSNSGSKTFEGVRETVVVCLIAFAEAREAIVAKQTVLIAAQPDHRTWEPLPPPPTPLPPPLPPFSRSVHPPQHRKRKLWSKILAGIFVVSSLARVGMMFSKSGQPDAGPSIANKADEGKSPGQGETEHSSLPVSAVVVEQYFRSGRKAEKSDFLDG